MFVLEYELIYLPFKKYIYNVPLPFILGIVQDSKKKKVLNIE